MTDINLFTNDGQAIYPNSLKTTFGCNAMYESTLKALGEKLGGFWAVADDTSLGHFVADVNCSLAEQGFDAWLEAKAVPEDGESEIEVLQDQVALDLDVLDEYRTNDAYHTYGTLSLDEIGAFELFQELEKCFADLEVLGKPAPNVYVNDFAQLKKDLCLESALQASNRAKALQALAEADMEALDDMLWDLWKQGTGLEDLSQRDPVEVVQELEKYLAQLRALGKPAPELEKRFEELKECLVDASMIEGERHEK